MKTMKTISTPLAALVTFFLLPTTQNAQQMYDDAEGSKIVHYAINRGARIDSAAVNPAPDDVNASAKCIKYQRTRTKYDCLRIYPQGKFADVTSYASYEQTADKIKMKIFTTAPVGTVIEIQMGKKTLVPYPEGTHSQYQAKTTVTNAWQEIEFNYSLSPEGSKTAAGEIEFFTLLFNPNSLTNDIYYFDELTGPGISKPQSTAKAGRRK